MKEWEAEVEMYSSTCRSTFGAKIQENITDFLKTHCVLYMPYFIYLNKFTWLFSVNF